MSWIKHFWVVLILSILTAGGFSTAYADENDDKTAPRPAFVQGSVEPQAFVDQASTAGVAEVELAKQALAKSSSDEVRHFAQMMIEDHTAANAEVRKFATAKGLEIADDSTLAKQANAFALKVNKGESFDEAYARQQLDAHTKTLKLFRQAANSSDNELKSLADAFVPTLEHHYSMAEALVDTVAKAASQASAP